MRRIGSDDFLQMLHRHLRVMGTEFKRSNDPETDLRGFADQKPQLASENEHRSS